MNKIRFQKDYTARLIQPLLGGVAGEIEVHLNKSPISQIGFLILNKGDPIKEENIMYHRSHGTSVFVYAINRTNSIVTHNINDHVILTNSIDAMNYLSENTFQQMHIFKVSALDIFILGGKFFIDGILITIPNVNTSTGLINQTLQSGSINYVHIKDNNYFISTVKDDNLYQIAEITLDTNGNITNIIRYNIFPVSGKALTDEERIKLQSIEHAAEVNIQSNYTETNNTITSFIKNKPDLAQYMVRSRYDINNSGVVDNAELVNGLTIQTAVPAGALFIDTVYDDALLQAQVTINNSKVSNKTHTGEVTGSGPLTVQPVLISNKLYQAATGGEEILINNAGTLTKTTAQSIANLSRGIFNVEGGTASSLYLHSENIDGGRSI